MLFENIDYRHSRISDEFVAVTDTATAVSGLDNPPQEAEETSLYKQLEHKNPAMAALLHPNDTRRVKRALECSENNTLVESEHVSMFFDKCIVINIQCLPQSVLINRLNLRYFC